MVRDIPDRWTQYKPVGNKIQGTRFVAFKVPLKTNINESVEENTRLDCDLLLKALPDLGLIIDLTNTNRYYDPECFRSKGVEYRKLMIPGHVTPPEHSVQIFKQYVKDYLGDNEHNNTLIGVHCTHGVNRTGFFICNYMISEMTINPDEAIKDFSEARGHSIERQNYLTALKQIGNRSCIGEKQLDQSDGRLILKRRSVSKEKLIHFEQRWNPQSRYDFNRPSGRPQYSNVNFHVRRHSLNNKNVVTIHDKSTNIYKINRRNSVESHNFQNTRNTKNWRDLQYENHRSNHIANWRDRHHEDQRTKRNEHVSRYDEDRSKFTWNRNSRHGTNVQRSRSNDTYRNKKL